MCLKMLSYLPSATSFVPARKIQQCPAGVDEVGTITGTPALHQPMTSVSLGLGGYGFLCGSCEAAERMTILPYYGYIIEEEGDAKFI